MFRAQCGGSTLDAGNTKHNYKVISGPRQSWERDKHTIRIDCYNFGVRLSCVPAADEYVKKTGFPCCREGLGSKVRGFRQALLEEVLGKKLM